MKSTAITIHAYKFLMTPCKLRLLCMYSQIQKMKTMRILRYFGDVFFNYMVFWSWRFSYVSVHILNIYANFFIVEI